MDFPSIRGAVHFKTKRFFDEEEKKESKTKLINQN